MLRKIIGLLPLIIAIMGLLLYVLFEFRGCYTRRIQEDYGIVYNKQRLQYGVPIIPVGWKIKERNSESIYWCGDERVTGHKRKTVMFSGSDIYGELDVYNLLVKNADQRLAEVEHWYNQKHQIDSVIYTYQVAHTAFKISKIQMDSVLNAESIIKDY